MGPVEGGSDPLPSARYLVCVLVRPQRACCSRGNPELLVCEGSEPGGSSVLEKMSPGDGI